MRIWDVEGRRELATLSEHESWVTSVAFAPDGLSLLSGGMDSTVFLWDLQKNAIRQRLQGHDNARIRGVGFSRDGTHALSCGGDGEILLWDPANGKLLLRMQGHTKAVSAAVFAPDSKRVASASWDGTLRVWDLKADSRPPIEAHKGGAQCVAWSPDGRRLVSGGDDAKVRLWVAESGEELLCLHGHTKTVTGVAVSADGRYALSGSADCTVRLWELPK